MKRGTVKAVVVVVIVLAAALFGGWYYLSLPKESAINIQVTPEGGYFQNLTVSCYGCVASGNDKVLWQGVWKVGDIPLDINSTQPKSTGISLSSGVVVPITPSSPCYSGYTIDSNSYCVYSVGPLPVTLAFNIDKVSTGGVLKVTVYLYNREPLTFQTPSGNLSNTLILQAA